MSQRLYRHFIITLSFNPHISILGKILQPHFTYEETKTQKWKVTCPKSLNNLVTKPSLK